MLKLFIEDLVVCHAKAGQDDGSLVNERLIGDLLHHHIKVPFCKDLPSEQLSAMAASLELRGYTTPSRAIFLREQECFGEAYIMFTGTADLVGWEHSGDRLIKEGDLFGDEYFGVGALGVHKTPCRKSTAISRTSPCELLILPRRECLRLQAYMAIRNKEEAMVVFEKSFHSMLWETRSELSTLATLRKVNMNSRLAVKGNAVTDVFFVIRGECVARSSGSSTNISSIKHVEQAEEIRCGPGHIVGWWLLMPEPRASSPVSSEVGKQSLRRGHDGKVWNHNVKVTTPAQVLSVPIKLLTILSERALHGLRDYISPAQGQVLEQDAMTTASSADTTSSTRIEWFDVHSYLQPKDARTSGQITRERRTGVKALLPSPERASSILDTAKPSRQICAIEAGQIQPSSLILDKTSHWNSRQFRKRFNSGFRWRWRMDIAEEEESMVQRETTLHRLRNCRMERHATSSVRERAFGAPGTVHAVPVLATHKTRFPKFSLATNTSNQGASNDQDAQEVSAACLEKAVQQDAKSNQTIKARSRAPVNIGGLLHPADEDVKVPLASSYLTGLTTPAEERANDITATQREPRRLYALVQLSRRPALDPSNPSASLCLRILGSFKGELEAKMRVLKLYHSILPATTSWQPSQGSRGRGYDCIPEDCSDVLFLLRKGIPWQLLGFNGHSLDAERAENPLERSEEGGKGFDVSIPAVFRAKVQLFATALVPSTENIEDGWDRYRKTLRNEGERSEHKPMADEAPPTIEDYLMPDLGLSVVDEVEADCNSHSEGGREIAGEQDRTGSCPDNVGTSPVPGDAETEPVKPLSEGADMADQTKAVESLKNDDDDRTGRGSIASLSEAERELCEDWMVDTSESTSSESDREHRLSTQSESGKSFEVERKEEEYFPCKLFGERAAAVPWLLSRMGFLEKVVGCYETETAAFRKAIQVLEEMEIAASSERILLDSQDTEAREELSSRFYHRQPSYRACVFPLYRWISLGDGLISSLEAVIGEHSVSNDAKVARAGVNSCDVLDHHQARRLRANLHDMLKGTRLAVTRCHDRAEDESGKMSGGGQRMTTQREKKVVIGEDERGFGGSNAERNLRRRTPKREMYEARKTVLQHNEKLLEAEMDVRRQLVNSTLGAIDPVLCARNSANSTLDDRGKAKVDTKPNNSAVNTIFERRKGMGVPTYSTWINEGVRPGTTDERCRSARYKLRAQMSIEQKRAQFFEDIQMLPYNQCRRRAKGNASKADASSPGIVLRADSVRDQTRLHGKPAVLFFNNMHGRRSAAGEKPLTDETRSISSKEKTVKKEVQAKTSPQPLPRKGNNNKSDSDKLSGKVNSSIEGVSSTGDAQAARYRGLSTTHHSRCNTAGRDRGHRGFSRQDGMGHALNDGDGVCSLEAKLVLLDEVLHDPQMKVLVENTLGHNR